MPHPADIVEASSLAVSFHGNVTSTHMYTHTHNHTYTSKDVPLPLAVYSLKESIPEEVISNGKKSKNNHELQ